MLQGSSVASGGSSQVEEGVAGLVAMLNLKPLHIGRGGAKAQAFQGRLTPWSQIVPRDMSDQQFHTPRQSMG